jgi:hypothetical protein
MTVGLLLFVATDVAGYVVLSGAIGMFLVGFVFGYGEGSRGDE